MSFVGKPERVVLCYARWKQLYLDELQGTLRDDKGKIFAQPSSGVTEATIVKLGLPCGRQPDGSDGVTVVHDGCRVLGAPVGTDAFKVAFALARVDEVIEAMDTASFMPELQLQHLLTAGSLIHRITHLLRNIPGGERRLFQSAMVKYDAAVMDAPRRLARLTVLPSLQKELATLSQDNGGLGYRTWGATADAAYLASYTHTAKQFTTLFPALAPQFPDVLTLASVEAAAAASPAALFALRALTRIESTEVAVGLTRACLQRDQSQPLRHLQHSLATISDDARHRLAVATIAETDNASHPRHMAVHLSHCGDSTTLSLVPKDTQTTFSNPDFVTALRRRILVPLQKLPEERAGACLTCPTCGERSDQNYGTTSASRIDVYGDHALRCSKGSKLRIAWHDSIKYVYAFLAKMVGLRVQVEPENMMFFSNDRPDMSIYDASTMMRCVMILDVRTAVVTVDKVCSGAAAKPGHAAAAAATDKDAKWVPQASAQGLTFHALVSEDGGRLGAGALLFVEYLASHAGASPQERQAFATYALQRLRFATVKGACTVINARLSSGSPPERQCRDLLPLGQPKPRPGASRARALPRAAAPAPPWQHTRFPPSPLLPQQLPWGLPPLPAPTPGVVALEGATPLACPAFPAALASPATTANAAAGVLPLTAFAVA